MDGDRERDPHWNTGLNSLGPKEKQKEGERAQERQDQIIHNRRTSNGQKTLKVMLNLLSDQGNANQNNFEIPSYKLQNS